jgi:hypothetical protein
MRAFLLAQGEEFLVLGSNELRSDGSWEGASLLLFRSVHTEGALNTPKKKSAIPNDKVALYDKLIATIPEIKRKGAANPYSSLNGNMFTLLYQSRSLAIRLPEDKREEFLKKYKTALFKAYGATMTEYVAVPDGWLKNTEELRKYLELSYEYVKTLRPKATKKRP